MDKKTKIFIGIGLVGVAGFLYWKSKQPKNMVGLTKTSTKCPCPGTLTYSNGVYGVQCDNGGFCPSFKYGNL
jgi:hypothetical protein